MDTFKIVCSEPVCSSWLSLFKDLRDFKYTGNFSIDTHSRPSPKIVIDEEILSLFARFQSSRSNQKPIIGGSHIYVHFPIFKELNIEIVLRMDDNITKQEIAKLACEFFYYVISQSLIDCKLEKSNILYVVNNWSTFAGVITSNLLRTYFKNFDCFFLYKSSYISATSISNIFTYPPNDTILTQIGLLVDLKADSFFLPSYKNFCDLSPFHIVQKQEKFFFSDDHCLIKRSSDTHTIEVILESLPQSFALIRPMLLCFNDCDCDIVLKSLKAIRDRLSVCKSLTIISKKIISGSSVNFVEDIKKEINNLVNNACFNPVANFEKHLNNTISLYIQTLEQRIIHPNSHNFLKSYAADALIQMFFHTSRVNNINAKNKFKDLYGDPTLDKAINLLQEDYEDVSHVVLFDHREEIIIYSILISNNDNNSKIKKLCRAIAFFVFLYDDTYSLNFELIRSILKKNLPEEQDAFMLRENKLSEVSLDSNSFAHFIFHSKNRSIMRLKNIIHPDKNFSAEEILELQTECQVVRYSRCLFHFDGNDRSLIRIKGSGPVVYNINHYQAVNFTTDSGKHIECTLPYLQNYSNVAFSSAPNTLSTVHQNHTVDNYFLCRPEPRTPDDEAIIENDPTLLAQGEGPSNTTFINEDNYKNDEYNAKPKTPDYQFTPQLLNTIDNFETDLPDTSLITEYEDQNDEHNNDNRITIRKDRFSSAEADLPDTSLITEYEDQNDEHNNDNGITIRKDRFSSAEGLHNISLLNSFEDQNNEQSINRPRIKNDRILLAKEKVEKVVDGKKSTHISRTRSKTLSPRASKSISPTRSCSESPDSQNREKSNSPSSKSLGLGLDKRSTSSSSNSSSSTSSSDGSTSSDSSSDLLKKSEDKKETTVVTEPDDISTNDLEKKLIEVATRLENTDSCEDKIKSKDIEETIEETSKCSTNDLGLQLEKNKKREVKEKRHKALMDMLEKKQQLQKLQDEINELQKNQKEDTEVGKVHDNFNKQKQLKRKKYKSKEKITFKKQDTKQKEKTEENLIDSEKIRKKKEENDVKKMEGKKDELTEKIVKNLNESEKIRKKIEENDVKKMEGKKDELIEKIEKNLNESEKIRKKIEENDVNKMEGKKEDSNIKVDIKSEKRKIDDKPITNKKLKTTDDSIDIGNKRKVEVFTTEEINVLHDILKQFKNVKSKKADNKGAYDYFKKTFINTTRSSESIRQKLKQMKKKEEENDNKK